MFSKNNVKVTVKNTSQDNKYVFTVLDRGKEYQVTQTLGMRVTNGDYTKVVSGKAKIDHDGLADNLLSMMKVSKKAEKQFRRAVRETIPPYIYFN